jgi:probable rRNA maturation factor
MEPRSKISRQDDRGGAAEILIESPLWRRLIPNIDRLAKQAAALTGTHATILLSTDRAVRTLNARHRGRDKPTNVLTFEPAAPGLPGDIILAYGTIRREAAAARRRPAHHLAHLIIHGALHLQGHDHIAPGDAARMERAETRLLHRLRIPNPWRAS